MPSLVYKRKQTKIRQDMKTRAFFFMVCIWLLATNGFAQNTIKGDGNIITKEISISDYDEISYVGKVNIEYEQSNASPFFKITIDENILPHFEIKVKGKTLIIQPKDERKYFNGNSYGLNLQPTVCEIKTNSRELKEISAVGGGEFVAKSPLKVDKLDISIAGSSTINFVPDKYILILAFRQQLCHISSDILRDQNLPYLEKVHLLLILPQHNSMPLLPCNFS